MILGGGVAVCLLLSVHRAVMFAMHGFLVTFLILACLGDLGQNPEEP